MLYSLSLLNIIDAWATTHGILNNYVREANPAMLALMENAGLGGFLLFKTVLSLFLFAMCGTPIHDKLRPIVSGAMVAYVGLLILHVSNVVSWLR